MAKTEKCNMCGKELDVFDLSNDYSMNQLMGYGSVYDGDEIRIQLCARCMDEIIKTCKISPIVKTYFGR